MLGDDAIEVSLWFWRTGSHTKEIGDANLREHQVFISDCLEKDMEE